MSATERLGVDQARARILDLVGTGAVKTVALVEAVGSVLARPVATVTDQPPFDNSAMDGYAVRSIDVTEPPVELRVVAVSAAGHPATRSIGPGEAARILTGALAVEGADAVVRIEDTDGGRELVQIRVAVAEGTNLRQAGEGARAGDVVLDPGTLLNAGHLGVAASAGVDHLDVIGAPRVAVVATGDELVPGAEKPLSPGQIRESNSIVVSQLLARLGVQVSVHRCGDHADELRSLLDTLAADHDVVVTSGGVSMGGEYDSVRAVLSGDPVTVCQLDIRPAKPLAFGRLGDALFVGLPGNPVSTVVAFELFVRPAIRKLRGITPHVPPTVQGVAGEQLSRRSDPLTHYLRVRRDDQGRWRSTGAGGSHLLGGIADAEALAVLDPSVTQVPVGGTLTLVPLWT